MKKQKYDIFISYRRDTGRQYARILQMALEKMGYRVFLDYDELNDGIFSDKIKSAISEAPIFMPILSKQYLVRCTNEGDWVREEIMLAINQKKHFVPVNPDNTHDGIPANIPKEIVEAISNNQHSEILFGQPLNATIKMMVDNRILPRVKPGKKPPKYKYLNLILMIAALFAIGALIYYWHKSSERRKTALEECMTKSQYEDFIKLYPDTKEAEEAQKILNEMQKLKNGGWAFLNNTSDEEIGAADKDSISVKWDKEISLTQLKAIRNLLDWMAPVAAKDSVFIMGADVDKGYEKPSHRVTLTEDFYMCKYETKRSWWEAVMNNSEVTDSADFPVSNISFKEAMAFVNNLNRLTGLEFALPTEAQWEWAATSGKSQAYSGSDNPDEVAWFDHNSDATIHEVGTVEGQGYNDNELYDMSGNVAELCLDYMGLYSAEPQTDPLQEKDIASGMRVVRGGSIHTNARDLNVRKRFPQPQDEGNENVGFRLILRK